MKKENNEFELQMIGNILGGLMLKEKQNTMVVIARKIDGEKHQIDVEFFGRSEQNN